MNDQFLVLYSDRDSGKFGNIGVFSPDEFRAACSPEGFTISFGNPVNLDCREQGFIDDTSFTKEKRSAALANYFMYGRFHLDLLKNPNLDRSTLRQEMEKWIETYGKYMLESDLLEVKNHQSLMKRVTKRSLREVNPNC